MNFNQESAQIRENRKKPEASEKHKFKAAEWTHPNGHPRCLVCGDEETMTGMCNDDRKAEPQEIDKAQEPQIEYMDIRDIYPNPWNRKLNREKVDGIKRSIRDMGQLKPLVVTEVDKRGKKVIAVTDGHHRLEALKELGHKGKIPVVWAYERGLDTGKDAKPKAIKKVVDGLRDLTKYYPTEEQAAGRQDVPQKKPVRESNTTSFKSVDVLRNLAGEFNKIFKQVIEAPVSGLGLVREDLEGSKRKRRKDES